MQCHNTAGQDGILIDFIQAALEEEYNTPPGEHNWDQDAPITKTLCKLFNYVFDFGVIPQTWQMCKVISIPLPIMEVMDFLVGATPTLPPIKGCLPTFPPGMMLHCNQLRGPGRIGSN